MKRNDSRALARIKRIYKSVPKWWINVRELSYRCSRATMKRCESITEFLNKSRYAKLLRDTPKPYRDQWKKIEAHQDVKRSRVVAKKQIQEGIQEFEERYDETGEDFLYN